jgi:hypothetical protein
MDMSMILALDTKPFEELQRKFAVKIAEIEVARPGLFRGLMEHGDCDVILIVSNGSILK